MVAVITGAKRAMISSAFVCLFVFVVRWQDYVKTTHPISTQFDGKVAHGPRKKPLDFGGNTDHVTLWL